MEPDKPSSRLAQQQQAHQEINAAQGQTGLEFRTAEELIRHDAAQTIPPERLARRVQDSVNREGVPPRSWWRRWFGW